MQGYGEVVSGDYSNATVTADRHGRLGFQSGLKRRKLTIETVAEWDLINVETRSRIGSVASVTGKALDTVVGSAFLGSLFINLPDGAKKGSRRTVRIDWVDGKQSVITLPNKLFESFEADLKDRRAAASLAPEPQALLPAPVGPSQVTQPDVIEQIAKLATLREQEILTEDEFVTKKAELLRRI